MAPKTKAARTATKASSSTKKVVAKKKASAKKAAVKKAPGKKAAAKKAAAKKAPVKKVVAKKKAAVKKAHGKKAAAKKAAAKKAPVKKVVAKKKAAVKKAPVKKAPVKQKAAAKTAPAKTAPATRSGATQPVEAAPVKAAPIVKHAPASSRSRGGIPALAKREPNANDRKAPPKRKGPLDKFLLGQLETLKQERVTYAHQAASLKAEADLLMAEREPGDVQFDEESGEGDTLAVERERDLTLSASAQAAVEDIDRAIEKLSEGTYGVCEQCYTNIPKERLRALPYAALCVQCKSAGFSRR